MSDRTEHILTVLACLLVLFSATLDPRVSAGLAVGLSVGYGACRLFGRKPM